MTSSCLGKVIFLCSQSLLRTIGNGRKPSIWDDAWVPDDEDFKIQNMESNLALTPSNVAELIDSNTRKWRTESIHNTFTEGDAERILCIPLSMNAHKDHIVWQGEATKEYSVWSGHKLLLQDMQTQRQQIYRQFSKKLWNLDLPPKIKITN
ncbi:hypothetical protein Goshw_005772 [Gossypium schwendimanii]|uniref:Uncharacterized protein n=1 Tax=Gossypium schwendimanii TaxID=34291 RepID=A0A7J9N075_GOSSC|nr:hypothetical protein [Gossypium schwendimanii]